MALKHLTWLSALLAALFLLVHREAGADPAFPQHAVHLRRPVAAAVLNQGRTLCVANQRSGTLSLVDLATSTVREEIPVGKSLTDLAVVPGGQLVLVTDNDRHELLALDGDRLGVLARLRVGPYPASVVALDGNRAAVASTWSRRVEIVDLNVRSSSGTLDLVHSIRLPFAPRDQFVLPESSQVVVADAFGGRLAVVDTAAGRLVAVHELTGHNVRGLAISADGKRLLVSHQILDQKAPTTPENIERGVLMANVVRSIPLDQLGQSGVDLDSVSELLRLGGPGAGAGDPAGLAVLPGGQVAIALAGVHEVALVAPDGKSTRRIAVGRRPTQIITGPPEKPLVVVNTFDDSLSLLDPRRGEVVRTIALGPQPKLTDKERGELLFHDARLARDGWMSCQSCHPDGHTNGLLADTLGDGSYGTPKRTLTVLNTAMTDPWGWNGQFRSLHDQVRASLVSTLRTPAPTWQQTDDLVSFLATLPPPPPSDPITDDPRDHERVTRGQRVFEEHGCGKCHVAPRTYSTWELHDVGFADERGLRRFNPPSLRGVGQGSTFLHDNRAKSLEEVFTRFRHKVEPRMDPDDLADLVRFLRSL